MKQFYSIHDGEFLVGLCINEAIKECDLWIPVKDRGVDILLTNKDNYNKNVSLQVKSSTDHLPTHSPEEIKFYHSCGFWNFGQADIEKSIKDPKNNKKPADFWVIAIYSFFGKKTDCIVIKPTDLYKRFSKFKKAEKTYFWITNDGKCFETRGLNKSQQKLLMEKKYNSIDPARNFTDYLNNWEPVKKELGLSNRK